MEWTTVTVQFSFNSNWAIGFPFKFDLPIITACFPVKFFSTFLMSNRHPNGVHGTIALYPEARFPTFTGLKPSTSFNGLIALIIFSLLICSGSGSWTNIPEIFLSLFNSSILLRTSFSLTSDGYLITFEFMPTSLEFFSLFLTYIWLGANSPIKITVRPGTLFIFFFRLAISFFISSLKIAASFFPSKIIIKIIRALTFRKQYFF